MPTDQDPTNPNNQRLQFSATDIERVLGRDTLKALQDAQGSFPGTQEQVFEMTASTVLDQYGIWINRPDDNKEKEEDLRLIIEPLSDYLSLLVPGSEVTNNKTSDEDSADEKETTLNPHNEHDTRVALAAVCCTVKCHEEEALDAADFAGIDETELLGFLRNAIVATYGQRDDGASYVRDAENAHSIQELSDTFALTHSALATLLRPYMEMLRNDLQSIGVIVPVTEY